MCVNIENGIRIPFLHLTMPERIANFEILNECGSIARQETRFLLYNLMRKKV